MTSQQSLPSDLSDCDLLVELERAAACERHATARLIALLMEIDSRKLYASRGCSSLFTFCVQRLRFSEHAAYLRIEAARCARRFPSVLDKLSDGSVHLTAVSLVAPHLTNANCTHILAAATHKSKREVEQLVARLRPQPDVPSVVRKLPPPAPTLVYEQEPVAEQSTPASLPAMLVAPVPARPAVIKPLAPERYKVQFTVSGETHEKLRRVQDLIRHAIPNGDLSAIFDRALTLLLADLSKVKCGAADGRKTRVAKRSRSRHIPPAIKREVWKRDGGQCAFRGEQGRCTETGFLEFHHVVPHADGGETIAGNLELRCRSHNQYEADLWSGELRTPKARETHAEFGA
jgi:5-methylcytosine-specific restriction endonuclease McrA